MTRYVLPVAFALCAAHATAMELPWESSTPAEPPQYCRGFVTGGLDSKLVSGMSRTDLWLAWSYLIREHAAAEATATGEYQTGREAFRKATDNAAADAILRDARGDCGLGRSGLQITGW